MVLRQLHAKAEQIMRERRLQKELLRTLIIVLAFVIVGGGMVMGQMLSDHLFDRYVRRANVTEANFFAGASWNITGTINAQEEFAMDPLRDVFFEMLPNWSSMRGWLPDALLIPLVAANFLVNVLWRHNKVPK